MSETSEPRGVHASLADHAAVLGAALARWQTRDDTRPQPEIREAANTAMGAIDAMIRDLYQARDRLTAEIRASDDAADARARALLARIRGETPQ